MQAGVSRSALGGWGARELRGVVGERGAAPVDGQLRAAEGIEGRGAGRGGGWKVVGEKC